MPALLAGRLTKLVAWMTVTPRLPDRDLRLRPLTRRRDVPLGRQGQVTTASQFSYHNGRTVSVGRFGIIWILMSRVRYIIRSGFP